MCKYIKITQVKSKIGCCAKHKLILCALGLRRIGDTVRKIDSNSIRGMINKVCYMVNVKVE